MKFFGCLVCAIVISGCTSAPTSFVVRSPSQLITGPENEIPAINEQLSAADFNLMVNESLRAVSRTCPTPLKQMPVMISTLENQTAENLDVSLLRRELGDALTANGYLTVDKFSREDLANEIAYQDLGYTDKTQKIVMGRQSSPRHLVRVVLNSRSETGGENVEQRFTRYRISLQFVNSESSEIEPGCVGSAQIRKDYWKQKVGW